MDRIVELESEIAELRKHLHEKENELYELKKTCVVQPGIQAETFQVESDPQYGQSNGCKAEIGDKLPRWAIERYSRQILLPNIGVRGQERVCGARVLVVGAGGLGCPAASYLAGAGVGEIGLVDYDTVDVTNIHRQLLHGEAEQGTSKVHSAARAIRRINSHITVTPYNAQLDSTNALDIISRYEIVLDCSDNVPTRYLLNDACVLLKVPLISGSALKMEGQLTIYNYRAEKNDNEKDSTYCGPCYRCLFPSPPPPETVGSCSANGVCGPVPGAIGTLQALEAIKLVVRAPHSQLLVGRLMIFDGEDATFRIVKLRGRNPSCAACSEKPKITQLLDYETFCRSKAKEKDRVLKILQPHNRITATQLASNLSDIQKENSETNAQRHLLVDVRSEPEFHMCRIEGAVNYPINSLDKAQEFDKLLEAIRNCSSQVTFICRRGNDSQVVARRVLQALDEEHGGRITDLTGGLHAWAKHVDEQFPIY